MSAMSTYLNLDVFYAERPERQSSPECDYGAWWTDGPSWPRYRLSYVKATGEVYTMGFRGRPTDSSIELLAVVPPDPGLNWHRTLDDLLRGWSDSPQTLAWVRDRLAKYGGG